ncbi:hypothetical protein D3C72_455970 [compost metagenome]
MRRLGPWLKLFFSVVMVAYILWICDPQRLVPTLLAADAGLLLAGTAIWVVIQLLNVLKWQVLNRAQGLELPFRKLLDVYYMGMFFNTFLPSGFGGDALRAYELSRLTNRAGSSLSSVVIDRYTSLYSLIALAGVAILMAPMDLRVVPSSLVLLLCALGIGGFVILLQDRWIRMALRIPALAKHAKLAAIVDEMATSAAFLRKGKRAIGLSLGISLLFQFLTIVEHYMFMLALGLQVPFSYVVLFIPILTFVASLPISINGLGVREGGYAFFLGKVGVEPAAAVSVGLISLAMLILSGLWGALVYASRRRRVLPGKP